MDDESEVKVVIFLVEPVLAFKTRLCFANIMTQIYVVRYVFYHASEILRNISFKLIVLNLITISMNLAIMKNYDYESDGSPPPMV